MTFRKIKANEYGFSLIEISIALLVISILTLPLLMVWNQYLVKRKVSDTNGSLLAVESALTKYQARYGSYPIPENPNQSTNVAGAGQSAAGAIAACVGNDAVVCSTGGGAVLIGTVPYAMLGLPPRLAFDGYGHKLKYVVTTTATALGTFNENAGAIAVNKIDGSDYFNGGPRGLYLVASMGEDGGGAFSPSGALVVACFAGGNRNSENCDQDTIFWNNYNDTVGPLPSMTNELFLGGGANYFDDLSRTANKRGGGLWGYVANNPDIKTNLPGNVSIGFPTNRIPLTAVEVNGRTHASQLLKTKRMCYHSWNGCVEPEAATADYIPGLGIPQQFSPDHVVGAKSDSFYPDEVDINGTYKWDGTNNSHKGAGLRCIRNRPWVGITFETPMGSWNEKCANTILLPTTTLSGAPCPAGEFAYGVDILASGQFKLNCKAP